MTRLPVLPTLVVAAAAATMIGLGLWQLQRMEEKTRLLADYAAAASLPPLDLDPLLARGAEPPPMSFRRVLVTCRARDAVPEVRGGASRDGVGGYAYLVPCRPGAPGLAGRLRVNAGWSRLPDESLRLSLDGIAAGTLGRVRAEGPVTVVSAVPAPPLTAASAPPRLDEVPNNHFFYAFQWFFFAAAAVVIYVLALRRRLRRGDADPKSPRS